jgi:hypothetical protein
VNWMILLRPNRRRADDVTDGGIGFEQKLSVNGSLGLRVYFVCLNPSGVHAHVVVSFAVLVASGQRPWECADQASSDMLKFCCKNS